LDDFANICCHDLLFGYLLSYSNENMGLYMSLALSVVSGQLLVVGVSGEFTANQVPTVWRQAYNERSLTTDRRDACPTALTKTPLLELLRRYLVQFLAARDCYYV